MPKSRLTFKTLKEDIAMVKIQFLGKIDIQILEKEYGKILTDEIIVTNERISHIKERHPEDYSLFEIWMRECYFTRFNHQRY